MQKTDHDFQNVVEIGWVMVNSRGRFFNPFRKVVSQPKKWIPDHGLP